MCLAVYMGCNEELETFSEAAEGSLCFELCKWIPPRLERYNYVYYLGRKGQGDELECSCLLMEYVEWTDKGPIVSSDDLFPSDGPCPFDTLKSYVLQTRGSLKNVTLVCDDNGGCEHKSDASEYGELAIRPSMIKRGNLLFADIFGSTPWRIFHVIPDKYDAQV